MLKDTDNRIARGVVFLGLVITLLGSIFHYKFGYTHTDLSGHAWGSDDAYISFRYARNLAQGKGLVYNSGERVEGYSNLLFTLMLSLAFRAGAQDDEVILIAFVLNLCAILVAYQVFYRYLSSRFPSTYYLGLIGFALNPLIWLWTASGLETAWVFLLQLALFVAVENHLHDQTRAGAFLIGAIAIALTLMRADGFIAPLIILVYLLARKKWTAALSLASCMLVTLIFLTVWRLIYYGSPLPNTYYAKVTGSITQRLLHGLGLLAYMISRNGFIIYLAALLQSAWIWLNHNLVHRNMTKASLRLEFFLGLGWLGYWLLIGGDNYLERFLIILIPFGLIALLHLVQGWAVLPARFLPLLLALPLLPLITDTRFHYLPQKYDRWITLGHFLAEHHSAATLAIDAAGKVPYFSNLKTIDMLGLNNYTISRHRVTYYIPGWYKFYPEYVFSRKPDLIAAWFPAETTYNCLPLDLSLGLTQIEYEQHGYRLRYLLYTGQVSQIQDILDVSQLEPVAICQQIQAGYRYGILQKMQP